MDGSLSAVESHLEHLTLKNVLEIAVTYTSLPLLPPKKKRISRKTHVLDYILQSFWFFPVHLHFKFSFLQLFSASCDQSGTTQEINCGRLLSNTDILHIPTAPREESGQSQDGFLARLPTAWQVIPASPGDWGYWEQLLVGCLGETQNLGAVFCEQGAVPTPQELLVCMAEEAAAICNLLCASPV